jgi:hypothetical protein
MRVWNKPGIPHKGWVCVEMEDLGSPEFTCEMCGKEEIRFKHHMFHEIERKHIAVGCVCAGAMQDGYENALEREYEFRKMISRLDTFLNKTWSEDTPRSGYSDKRLYIKNKGYTLSIYVNKPKNDPLKYISKGINTFTMQTTVYAPYFNSNSLGKFSTLLQAKKKLFEEVDSYKGKSFSL